MSNPNTTEYLQLSANAYADESAFDSSSSGPVYVDGDIAELVSVPETLTKYDGMTVIAQSPTNDVPSGFAAIAVEDASGNIIIINEGTVPGITGFDSGTISADIQIGEGKTPAALNDAAAFAQQVESIATTQNHGNSVAIYVTGHSLGGIEAEQEAQTLVGINSADFGGGATFGATGLPGQTAAGGPKTLIDYVDYGDPVGNYARDTTTQTMNDLAPNAPVYYHYGTVREIGPTSNAAYLKEAQVYSEIIDPQDKLSFEGGGASVNANILATADEALAIRYHGIANYASDITGSASGITGAGSPPPPLDWITQQAEQTYGNAANSAIENVASDGSVSTPYFTVSYNVATDQITIDQTGNLGTSSGTANGGGVTTLSLDPTNGLVKSATYASSDGSIYNAIFSETTGDLQSLEVNESDGASYQIKYTFNSDGSFSSTTTGYSGTNLTGTHQFTQTDSVSSSNALSANISGTGDAVSLSGASITLASNASASVTGTGNNIILNAGATVSDSSSDFATDNLTFRNSAGNSVTLKAGTFYADSQYSNSGTTDITLKTPDYSIGTLSFNTSTNAASFALTLEGGAPGFNDHVSFALPSIGKDTVAALSSTTTPYQALKSYLADLGYTASLSTLNFNDLNPTGTAYDVTGTVTGLGQSPANGQTVADVAYTPYLRPGAQIDGQATAMYNGGTTYNAYNIIDILTGTFVDLTQDTWSDMQALTLNTGSTAELTAAQFGSLPDITGSGTLVITTAGNVSLTAVDAQPDHGTFNLTAQGWGGTTLNGDATNGQVLTASLYGNDTLNAGSGFFDGLVAGQGVDILNAPGFDTILAADGLAAGSKASGVAGETVLDAGGDISHATISGITTLTLGGNSPLGLTASQLALFTTIYLAGDNALNAESGGTYNLLNAPFANATAGMSIALNAVSNSATTLEGNDTSGGSGLTSLLSATGNGADTLSTGGAAGDSLTASGSGNDKLTAGNGNNDTLSATGNGNDTLKAANDNAAMPLRPVANDDCALQITLLRVA